MATQKTVVILSIFIFTLQKSFSQPLAHQTFFKAGVNINDLGGRETGIYNSFGFHAGIGYEYVFSSYFSLQPELLFSLQGGKVEQSSNTRLNYYYLNLPLLAKVFLVDKLSLEAGPQFGYLLWANENSDFGRINITRQVKRTDFAIAFGFGYQYRDKTSFAIRYNLGISNTNEQGVILRKRQSNRVLQASVGFVF